MHNISCFKHWKKCIHQELGFFFLATLQENNMGHSYQKYYPTAWTKIQQHYKTQGQELGRENKNSQQKLSISTVLRLKRK